LKAIAADDPVSCAEYAKKNNLPSTDGWKQFWCIAKSEKKLQQMINQAKLKTYQHDTFWKFGVLIPCNHAQAVEIDKANRSIKWQDAEATEKSQFMEYNTIIDCGIGDIAPNWYKKIRCHMIYDVKHDAQLVAVAHLTDPNTESVYSGFV
jgi:hypothetical protein